MIMASVRRIYNTMKKQCSKCKNTKDSSLFTMRKGEPDSWCKLCNAESSRKSNAKNPERAKEYMLKNREMIKLSNTKRFKEIKEKYGIGARAVKTYGLKLALEIYDRAGRKCEKCGEKNDLTIHHKDRKGRNNENKGLKMNNRKSNLMILCRKCHGSIHGKQRWENRNEVIEV